jgi:hypothetical protein
MSPKLQQFSETVAKAVDAFHQQYTHVDTLMGVMDKNLRNQGMQADAVTIDCVMLNKKIVFVLHDNKPDMVDIALGNKEGDIFSSSEHQLSIADEIFVKKLMETNFVS